MSTPPQNRATAPGQAPAVLANPHAAAAVPFTVEELDQLGVSTDIQTTARALGVSKSTAYTMARAGTLPVRVIRVGARYVVPTADLRAALGIPAGIRRLRSGSARSWTSFGRKQARVATTVATAAAAVGPDLTTRTARRTG